MASTNTGLILTKSLSSDHGVATDAARELRSVTVALAGGVVTAQEWATMSVASATMTFTIGRGTVILRIALWT